MGILGDDIRLRYLNFGGDNIGCNGEISTREEALTFAMIVAGQQSLLSIFCCPVRVVQLLLPLSQPDQENRSAIFSLLPHHGKQALGMPEGHRHDQKGNK